ncbi:MAG: hypothetical protein Q8R45_10035 [Brevundimonas sp.]|uniref:hypothetical protein n=1 Tax=Brevundimonas sp. TaxID=1871086 RepID=UPI00271A58EF|nr:hypothetical protein [Brevundimonas sp.]MDO9588981.1 hypothetical protein [Brevundimonas sp.]MDP3657288.1 hypothetical protein [Brevundimonas sp.]MDZ4060595.1 hypothetical protein [Brevundimonas sp.]
MKRLTALLALTCVIGLTGCEDPRPSGEPEFADTSAEAPVADAATDAGEPVAAPAVAAPPADSTAVPPEKRTSEESVQPESETLFY